MPSGTLRAEYNSVMESISSAKLRPLAREVAKLRLYKSESEQRIMRSSANISALAHAKVRNTAFLDIPRLTLFLDYALHGSRHV